MRKCWTCGKVFDVLYPELWRFKEGTPPSVRKWFCSWKCLRADEKKGIEKKMARPRKDGTPARAPQKKAEVQVKKEIPDDARILGQEPLETAAVFSRVIKGAEYQRAGKRMVLRGLDAWTGIEMTAYEWFKLTEEILVAIRQLDMTKPMKDELDPEEYTGNNGPLPAQAAEWGQDDEG